MKTILALPCILLLSSIFMLKPVNVFAQDTDTTTTTFKVVTINGNEFIGTILSETSEQVVLRTEDGEITLLRSNIKSIISIDPAQIKDGNYWFKNPHATRFWFRTGRRLLSKHMDIF